MKYALAASTAFILFVGTAIGIPQPVPSLFARQAITTNGSCGHDFRCSTARNRCCSKYGWCGDTDEYCGVGCQSAYGSCGTAPSPTETIQPISGRPKLGNVSYGVAINACSVPGTVALTFDDGPYIYTQGLLNMLNARGVKATFFFNGANWGPAITVDSNAQQVIRNAYNSGHQIASHTWSHPDLNILSPNEMVSQMVMLEIALLNIIGRYPTYMRPPYLDCGTTCLNTLNALGYHVITTNLDTQDWLYNTPDTNWQSQQIYNKTISSTSGTSGKWLVMAHSVHVTTVDILAGYMVDRALAQGYRLVTVGECLGDSPANWYRTTLWDDE